jgi:hypothetical protein
MINNALFIAILLETDIGQPHCLSGISGVLDTGDPQWKIRIGCAGITLGRPLGLWPAVQAVPLSNGRRFMIFDKRCVFKIRREPFDGFV